MTYCKWQTSDNVFVYGDLLFVTASKEYKKLNDTLYIQGVPKKRKTF